MSGMDGLAEFLAARYGEAEAQVRAAMDDTRHCYSCDAMASGEWAVHPTHPPLLEDQGSGATIVYDGDTEPRSGLLAYMAGVDPKHRLADIKLKRAILALHTEDPPGGFDALRMPGNCRECSCDGAMAATDCFHLVDWPCATVRQLGTEFGQHPAYRKEWAPED